MNTEKVVQNIKSLFTTKERSHKGKDIISHRVLRVLNGKNLFSAADERRKNLRI